MNIILFLSEPVPGKAYEYQTVVGRDLVFEYDAKYDACVCRIPLNEWRADNFAAARSVLCQSLHIPVLFDIEIPVDEKKPETGTSIQDEPSSADKPDTGISNVLLSRKRGK